MIFGGIPALVATVVLLDVQNSLFGDTSASQVGQMTTLYSTPDAARLQSNRENVRETSKRNARTMHEILELSSTKLS